MPRKGHDFEEIFDADGMDDEALQALIEQELEENPDLDPELIEVAVAEGVVTLSGRVGTEHELQAAERVLTDVLGVSRYRNDLVLDELVRGQRSEAADEAAAEDREADPQGGAEGERTDPSADHLLEDTAAELYGTQDISDAIERGQSYNPPDRPQEGSWSVENH